MLVYMQYLDKIIFSLSVESYIWVKCVSHSQYNTVQLEISSASFVAYAH